ncbi:MAG TPA: DUF1697 domain-containing protein [Thermoanaerobaculia bacterium]|jgi:uncharacterized protein (DUF1697 family)|nr:DUF1697 domain-containing protein [Thermoanaerobaculia bacterium]
MATLPHYVAFLRALNVGGTSVIKMDDLRRQFEKLGFTNVKTVLASGNVLFDAKGSAPALTKAIASIGYTACVRTRADVLRIAEYDPFGGKDPDQLYISFLEKKPAPENVERLLASGPDQFHVDGTEAYWFRRRDAAQLPSGNVFEKILGVKATMRGVKTIRRIAAIFGDNRD